MEKTSIELFGGLQLCKMLLDPKHSRLRRSRNEMSSYYKDSSDRNICRSDSRLECHQTSHNQTWKSQAAVLMLQFETRDCRALKRCRHRLWIRNRHGCNGGWSSGITRGPCRPSCSDSLQSQVAAHPAHRPPASGHLPRQWWKLDESHSWPASMFCSTRWRAAFLVALDCLATILLQSRLVFYPLELADMHRYSVL